jgi:type 1 glutamine amidotransferase
MNKLPRYLLTDQFDLGMLSSLTAGITLTEISLEEVCQIIEEAEREKELGLHGGWVDAVKNKEAVCLVPNGQILLVARPFETGQGTVMKWVQIEVVD